MTLCLVARRATRQTGGQQVRTRQARSEKTVGIMTALLPGVVFQFMERHPGQRSPEALGPDLAAKRTQSVNYVQFDHREHAAAGGMS